MKTTPLETAPTWPLKEGSALRNYLEQITRIKPNGLCTDIDGTISLTAPTVDDAVLLPGMQELLDEATRKFDLVATISGRAVESQKQMIGLENIWHVGHHGYEWEEASRNGKRRTVLYPKVRPYLKEIEEALNEIEIALRPLIPGLWMERKGITGGVHWRLAKDHEKAEIVATPIIKAIAAAHGLRYRAGRLAVELYPPMETNKGEGLKRLVKKHNLKSVLYFGDEISDADAFIELHRLQKQGKCKGIAIGVIYKNSPEILKDNADMLVQGPEEVKEIIQWLVSLTNRET